MAGAAELLLIVDGYRLSGRLLGYVAGNASCQAVLGGADAFMDRRVALVLDHLHVIAAHEITRLHAALLFRGLRSRDHEITPAGLDGQGQQGPG